VQALGLVRRFDLRAISRPPISLLAADKNVGRLSMKLNDEQINQQLTRISNWHREGDEIIREFKFDNFKRAVEFVNRVADQAEALNHHPDIFIHDWNRVRLSVTTHDAGGLTERDFNLAEHVNRLTTV
jgi:4a-hydroxytetrahydrobiopterin dehydratase